MEKRILAAIIKDRVNYDYFEKYGNTDEFSNLGKLVFRLVAEYYGNDRDAGEADFATIEDRGIRSFQNPKHEAPYREFIGNLPRDVSELNVRADVRALHRQRIGEQLSIALANREGEDRIASLIAEYGQAEGEEEVEAAGDTDVELLDIFDTSDLTDEGADEAPLIKLWPKELNDRIDGGAKRGHHVLVYARPEAGKTLFCINLCAGFLHQKLAVLYVGNEEPASDIRDRIRARLLKTTKQEVRRERTRAGKSLSGLGRLNVAALAPGTFDSIGRILARDSYDVCVLDQVRNIRVSKSDSRANELESAATAARQLAKRCNVLVVSVTQAGDSATDKVYLEMNDVDSSKTGLPAQADLMIGVGGDQSMKLHGLMGISLPKNKLSGDHSKFTVSYNTATGVIG